MVLTGLWLEGTDGQRAAFVCCCRTREGSPYNSGDYGSFFLPANSVPALGSTAVCPLCDDKHRVVNLEDAVKDGLFNTTPNSDRDWFYGPNVEQVLRQDNAWRKGRPKRWRIAAQQIEQQVVSL